MSRIIDFKWIAIVSFICLVSCKGGSEKHPATQEDTNESQLSDLTLTTPSHTFKNEMCKGVVKSVSDGDTYNIILSDETTPRRVRMAAIDAPEKGQDFYRKSRRYLDSLIWKKEVVLLVKSLDSFGRLLAFTYLPDGREVSHEMVRMGYAWHYNHYDNDAVFDTLQALAKEEKRGLWVDEFPVEPWIEKTMRKKGYKSDEIKKMKREGLIPDIGSAKKIEPKEK